MPIKCPSTPETWKAWWVVGILFPAHIVLGVASVPMALYHLFWARSPIAWALAALYCPFYLYPAQVKYPGWKGFDSMWAFFDYGATCESYFGEFRMWGGKHVDKTKQHFVACHPHGAAIFQRTFWRTEQLEGLFGDRPWRMLGASVLFKIPIVREMSLWFGAVDASRPNCDRLLKAGCNLCVFPGGLDEANSSEDAATGAITIRTRTGFIRLAVQHGACVLPVFCFGELDAVASVRFLPRALSDWLLRTWRMSSTGFLGRYYSFVPKRVPFNLCLGAPIATQQAKAAESEAAFDAEVARVHVAYKAELKRLYGEYQERFGYEGRALVFACEAIEAKKSAKSEAGNRK